MKIKILQVLDQVSQESGVSSVVMNYYQYLDKKNYQMDFMVNRPVEQKLKEKIEENGSRIFLMPELCIRNGMAYPKALKVFFKEHREYQIVHGHVANAAAFYMRAAIQEGIAIRILHAHNSCGADRFGKRMRNRVLAEWGIKNSNYYAACGKKAAVYLFGTERGVKIIPNAIEEKRFRFQNEIREQMRWKYQLQDRFILGHVGRFCPQKNQRFLIALIEKLIHEHGTYRRPHLLLIGNGEEKERISHLIKSKGLENDVTMEDVKTEIEDYYQMMDCFLLPSLFEGVPLVGVEAQFNGLPCIFSTQVTQEIASKQVRYLALEQQEKWIETIQEFERKEYRMKRIQEFEKKGNQVEALREYQIKEAVKGLEEFYQQCCNEKG